MNSEYSIEEFQEKLVDFLRKNIKINENYVLKDLRIFNFRFNGNLVEFELEVGCDLV
jgi:hypothetical protein